MVHVVRVPSHCGCCVLFSACLVLSASADSCSPCSFPFSFLYRITRHDERPQWPATARASSRRCPSFNCCDRAAPRSQAQPSPLPPALPRCGRAHNRPSLEYRPRSRAGSRQQGCPHQLPCRTPAGAPGLLRCSARASGPACAALPLGQRRHFFLPPAAARARAWPGYCGPPLAMPPVPAYTAGPAAASRPFFRCCRAAPAGIDRRPVLPLLRALSSWEEAR